MGVHVIELSLGDGGECLDDGEDGFEEGDNIKFDGVTVDVGDCEFKKFYEIVMAMVLEEIGIDFGESALSMALIFEKELIVFGLFDELIEDRDEIVTIWLAVGPFIGVIDESANSA